MDRVEVAANSTYFSIEDVSARPFSFASWFKLDAFETADSGFYFNIGSENFKCLSAGVYSGKLTMTGSTNGTTWSFGETFRIGTTTLTVDGLWHSFIGTRDVAGVYSVYLDGQLDGAVTEATDLFAFNSYAVRIGCHYALNTSYSYNGKLAGVSWYNYTLNAGQASAWHKATRGSFANGFRRKPLSIPYAPAAAAGGGSFPFNLYYGGGLV